MGGAWRRDEREAESEASIAAEALREKVATINEKLDRLTDVYIAQDIERHDYLSRRVALLSERKSVEEVLAKLDHGVLPWLEPMQEWIKEASMLDETAKNFDLPQKNPPSKKSSARTCLCEIKKSTVWLKHYTRSFAPRVKILIMKTQSNYWLADLS